MKFVSRKQTQNNKEVSSSEKFNVNCLVVSTWEDAEFVFFFADPYFIFTAVILFVSPWIPCKSKQIKVGH